ncbi:MAG: hypothetical protein EBR82_29060 [Caulobacteraceae bacterium]|nr:hypothetical protein [Caulobacteraceae bacterium]
MKCCLCESEILPDANGWAGGHNPEPIATKKGDRCCGECNDRVVVPTRIAIFFTRKETAK